MKNDQQLKTEVSAELRWDAAVNAANIGVAARDGVITLSGQVDTYLQKHAAERAVKRVAGVRGIAMDIEVKLAPGHARTDTDIAQAALDALRWHSQVPPDAVTVEVDQGWVTLSGEVDWGLQSASAERCVRPLIGVKGVTNQIRLRQHVNPAELRSDILAALTRQARREANHIDIAVEGGVVTLSGHVHSLPEHDAICGTASAARGVSRVVDYLKVGT